MMQNNFIYQHFSAFTLNSGFHLPSIIAQYHVLLMLCL